MLRSQKNHQFVAGAADVSGADGHNRVAGASFAQQKFDSVLHRPEIVDVFVSGFADGRGQRLTGDAGDWRFARGIDVEQHEHVGLIEGAAELVPEMLRARKAVRLKENEQAVELAATRRFERGANFGGVMAVVVDHGDVVHDTLQVEPASHAGKFRESFAYQVSRNVEIKRDRSGRSGVSHVVHSRRMGQAEQAEVFAAVGQAKLAVEAFQLYVADNQVGLARGPVGDDGTLHVGNNGLYVGLIEAQNRGAIERHAVHELNEGALYVFQRAVLVEVFAVDGCNDSNHRREHQEASVALIGFHDEILAFAETRGGARLIHPAANHKGRIKMRGVKN